MVEPWNPKEAVNVQWMECGESCPWGWEEVGKTWKGKDIHSNLFADTGPENLKTHNLAERYLLHFKDNPNEPLSAKRKACDEMGTYAGLAKMAEDDEGLKDELKKSEEDDWCTWCNLWAHELSEDKKDTKGCGNFDKEGNWVPNNKRQVKCKRIKQINATDVRNVDTTKWFGRGPFCRGRCPNKWIPLRYTKQGISGGNTLQRLPCWLGQKVECGRINSSTCEDVDCSFDNKNEPDCLQCSQCWWNSSNSECHPKSPSIDEDTKKCADELFDLGFPKRAATLLNKNTACRSYQEKETALAQCRRDIKGKGKERKRKEKEERKRKEKKENKRCEDFENALSDFKDTNKNFEDEFIRSHSNQNRKLDLIRRQLREAGLSLLKNIEPLTDEFRNLSCNSKIVIGETYEEIIKPTIETLIKIWREVIVIFNRVDVQNNIDNYRKQILEKRNKITSIEKEGKLSRKKKRKVKKINEEIKKMKAEIKQPNQRYGKLPPSFDSYVMNIMGESKAIADEIKENITEKIRDEYRDAMPLHIPQVQLENVLDETLNFLNFMQKPLY